MSYNPLLLENQICFPLYACSRKVVKTYKPHLDKIGITYTQYITLMVLWERESVNVKSIGEKLHLDSGTLTPLLKKMESDGLVIRSRSEKDERNLMVSLTEKGKRLREKALEIPKKVGNCIDISPEDARILHRILHEMLKEREE